MGGSRPVSAEIQIAVVESEQSNEARIARRVYDCLSYIGSLRLDTILKGPRRCLQAFQNFPLPDALEFRLKLRRLQKEKTRLYGLYAARHQECRQLNADDAQIEQLNYLEHNEIGIIDEQIYQLYFERITAQAERSFISIPDLQESREDWETARLTGRWRLRRRTLQDLVAAIRKAKKDRQEALQAKLIWVTAVTGMLGALTGLMSLLAR
jgi:hypothetical protein